MSRLRLVAASPCQRRIAYVTEAMPDVLWHAMLYDLGGYAPSRPLCHLPEGTSVADIVWNGIESLLSITVEGTVTGWCPKRNSILTQFSICPDIKKSICTRVLCHRELIIVIYGEVLRRCSLTDRLSIDPIEIEVEGISQPVLYGAGVKMAWVSHGNKLLSLATSSALQANASIETLLEAPGIAHLSSSKDGAYLLVTSSDGIRIIDGISNCVLSRLPVQASSAFYVFGDRYMLIRELNSIQLWDAEELHQIKAATYSGLHFLEEGAFLFSIMLSETGCLEQRGILCVPDIKVGENEGGTQVIFLNRD